MQLMVSIDKNTGMSREGLLRSERGATILIALAFALVCAFVGAAVLTAAFANMKSESPRDEEEQGYYSLTSALNLAKDTFLSEDAATGSLTVYWDSATGKYDYGSINGNVDTDGLATWAKTRVLDIFAGTTNAKTNFYATVNPSGADTTPVYLRYTMGGSDGTNTDIVIYASLDKTALEKGTSASDEAYARTLSTTLTNRFDEYVKESSDLSNLSGAYWGKDKEWAWAPEYRTVTYGVTTDGSPSSYGGQLKDRGDNKLKAEVVNKRVNSITLSGITVPPISLSSGYEFDGWYYNGTLVSSDSNPRLVKPIVRKCLQETDGDIELTANFVKARRTINYNVRYESAAGVYEGSGSGFDSWISSASEVVEGSDGAQGSSVVAGNVNPYYEFVGWYDSTGREVSTDLVFVPDDSLRLSDGYFGVGTSYTARFRERRVTIAFGPASGSENLSYITFDTESADNIDYTIEISAYSGWGYDAPTANNRVNSTFVSWQWNGYVVSTDATLALSQLPVVNGHYVDCSVLAAYVKSPIENPAGREPTEDDLSFNEVLGSYFSTFPDEYSWVPQGSMTFLVYSYTGGAGLVWYNGHYYKPVFSAPEQTWTVVNYNLVNASDLTSGGTYDYGQTYNYRVGWEEVG